MEVPEIWQVVVEKLLPHLPPNPKDAAQAIDCLASFVIFRLEMGGYGPGVTSAELVDTPRVVELHPMVGGS